MNNIVLKVKKLTEDAQLPMQAHTGDLWDIFANEDVLVKENEPTCISTGLAFEIPEGYQLHVFNRSGNPIKYGLIHSIGTGIIDTGYRGELMVMVHCLPGKSHQVKKGDKIGQMALVKLNNMTICEVNEISKTDRGAGGFGSTGK